MTNKMTAQEKREQKRLAKAHNAEIAKLNSNLIPVTKNCPAAMDVQFVDPSSGVFKKGNDKWLKVYHLSGIDNISTERRKEMLDQLILDLTIRLRFTCIYDPACNTDNDQRNYLSFVASGSLYLDVKKELDENEAAVSSVLSQYGMRIEAMDINAVMQSIQTNFGLDANFEYASSIRGKHNWERQCFAPLTDKESSFSFAEQFGTCYFGVQFPSQYLGDILSRFKEMGCPLGFAVDIQPLSAEVISDFNRAMETRYNRKLELSARRNLINCSFLASFLTDSEDARKIVETTLLSIFSNLGFVLAPCIGNEITVMNSILSMGVIDFHAMRNVSADIIPSLIL